MTKQSFAREQFDTYRLLRGRGASRNIAAKATGLSYLDATRLDHVEIDRQLIDEWYKAQMSGEIPTPTNSAVGQPNRRTVGESDLPERFKEIGKQGNPWLASPRIV